MTVQSEKWLKQKKVVDALEAKLRAEKKKLVKLCNHEFTRGTSFGDCKHCDMSEYYLGREDESP